LGKESGIAQEIDIEPLERMLREVATTILAHVEQDKNETGWMQLFNNLAVTFPVSVFGSSSDATATFFSTVLLRYFTSWLSTSAHDVTFMPLFELAHHYFTYITRLGLIFPYLLFGFPALLINPLCMQGQTIQWRCMHSGRHL